MSQTEPVSRALEPETLERFSAQRITTARFAYFEDHDEWTLEDITVAYSDGHVIEEPYSDTLEVDLRSLLEEASPEKGFYQDGYFLVETDEGTITKLDDAFVLELRWWQLGETVQRALEEARLV
jgi:hypothetical protein